MKIMSTRMSKNSYYLGIAETVSKRSTCVRRRYGCVVVNNDEIVGTGYNGSSRGEPNCIDSGIDQCIRKLRNIPSGQNYELCASIHAEGNALFSAGRKRCQEVNSESPPKIYLWGFDIEKNEVIAKPKPCLMCERLIKNAGIKKIITLAGEFYIAQHIVFSGECD